MSNKHHDKSHTIAPEAPKKAQDERKEPTPTPAPSQPLPASPAHAGESLTPVSTGSGNGSPWCQGENAPGYNRSTGKCENNPVNAITPEAYGLEKPIYVRLDQLPYTGINTDPLSISLYMAAVILGSLAIYRILQYKNWP